jgi:hypothetical protein
MQGQACDYTLVEVSREDEPSMVEPQLSGCAKFNQIFADFVPQGSYLTCHGGGKYIWKSYHSVV